MISGAKRQSFGASPDSRALVRDGGVWHKTRIMDAQTLPLALTMGDPAGCGPAITFDAWQDMRGDEKTVFYVHADPGLWPDKPVQAIASASEAHAIFGEALPVLPLSVKVGPVDTGTPDTAHVPAILTSIRSAFDDAVSGRAAGMVTNPISKALLAEGGFAHPGHTEFIAELASECTGRTHTPVMMLTGGGLRVALVTIHLSVRDAIEAISAERIARITRITHAALQRDFGIPAPRIALTGLNPHAGEDGLLGREEIDIIDPTAGRLRAEGINVTNARSADTVFAEMRTGAFDAVIAMTHDQGLIPVKTLDLWGGVNTTLGLPIIRTSPDHGTAYDAARAGTARADSLIAALKLAGEFARNRRNPTSPA